jgi:hypothetical protein
MRRKLVWIERPNFQGYGCSECPWVFKSSGTPSGKSLDEMKKDYEQQRDRDFAANACAERSRGNVEKG